MSAVSASTGPMTAIDGFWSYVHADDNAESGRIAQLARDVVAQFEMLTGESISLFLERDRLQWGDDWRPKGGRQPVFNRLLRSGYFAEVLHEQGVST